MRKLTTLLLVMAILTATAVPALAMDYRFEGGPDERMTFGAPTPHDGSVRPDPLTTNTRRNKDAAFMPPPFGVFSGEIPTMPSSPLHNNRSESGFVHVNQNLPPIGNEDYAPGGNSGVSGSFLPSTSQTSTLNTMPWLFEDGSMGTLFVERTGRTIRVYPGENDANLQRGAGHFSSTSAWDGNVALAGHNRGTAGHFSFVREMQNGDRLTFTTRYGTRTYEMVSRTRINEWDNSPLMWSNENTLTLITCVANQPDLRYVLVAREIRALAQLRQGD